MTVCLFNLKPTRVSLGITPGLISKITGIPLGRYKSLENSTNMEEPWLGEAIILSHILCTNGVVPLVTASGNLTDIDTGVDFPSDLDVWRSGTRLPLTDACRIARKLGLADPAHLIVPAHVHQMWDIVSRNERGAAPGACPYCLADGDKRHADTCSAHNLLGARDDTRIGEMAYTPRPRSKRLQRSTGAIAHGVAHIRKSVLCITQARMAEAMGVHPNYYAMVERKEVGLALHRAEQAAQAFKLDVATFYAPPPER